MSGNIRCRTIRESELARRRRHEGEVLAALQKEPLNSDDLTMICNMGRHEVSNHLNNLLDAGRIEREKAVSNYGRRPHEVWTGRYRATLRANSHGLKCAEPRAVSA